MLSKKIVKYIQSLTHKKLRDEENRFIAEGPKVVEELLLSKNFDCAILCASEEWLNENKDAFTKVLAENIHEVDEIMLQKISHLKTANQVVAVFEKKAQQNVPNVGNKISIMLDNIQDPGNLGTIIRIADWFGIENIICSDNCVDCYNPKVVQATMGSLGRVNIYYTSLTSFLDENKNLSVYAAALAGIPVYDLKEVTEGIILIGNEAHGIDAGLMKLATKKITIPKYGQAESLNAAVATGIILSHIRSKGIR